MELKLGNRFREFINEIENFLRDRKNLMVYEDYIDENLNSAYRFFYSNPRDFLEFISIDLYLNQEKEVPLGKISTITSKNEVNNENLYPIYGEVLTEEFFVRGIEKTKISLILNRKGYENIEDAIKYFEKNII
ncbi:hypothetical protein [Clostridium cylindrosporum]|uniref:Uncharacterized protein n=1 Tax=Clostridium cylindrosporum DSM 605 TaxID=1121307 RepID=A0A0J8DFT9_CLOCY|nr:hypothetical protein [Clostridium cylindrosporum]KMT23104.1 hypothetical protein CLCY_7c01510 [Clostridium cylindrosporum DSM 605]